MERIFKLVAAFALALATCVAAAAEAPLGAGDMVRLSVYGNPDLAIETRISEAGTIIVPLIGQIHIGGMPAAAAEKKIGAALESGGYLKKARVNMVVTAPQSQQVAVLGHVNRPGLYALEGRRSVFEVLAMAGGTSAGGGDMVSLVRSRDGSLTRDTIDIVQMVQSGQPERNIAVAGGDLVYVEPAPRFYIMGQVLRPGALRVERGMTVLQALAAGGGLTPHGTDRGIRITRRDVAGKLTVTEARHDDIVQAGDVITVRGSWF